LPAAFICSGCGKRGATCGRTFIGTSREQGQVGLKAMSDGLCASACTLVLGTVAHNKICVTSRATLGFHAAYDFGIDGRTIANPEATMMLYSMYPAPVRQWIAARGGLAPQMLFLRGQELQAMYRPCY
jgi:hypothetical protein